MCDKAVKLRYIDFNPFLTIELPKHKKEKGYALSQEEEKRFVSACLHDKYSTLFLICLYAGLRRGEALALTVGDINITDKTISVSKSFNQGKSHGTKTEAGNRIVPIFDNLLPYLPKNKTKDKSQRLFPINEANAFRHFSAVLDCANLQNKSITIHSLRHTFITRCYECGIDAKTVSKWVGHTDISLTLKVYTHCNYDFEKTQINKLNKGVKNNQ